jgi:hypothetical protein
MQLIAEAASALAVLNARSLEELGRRAEALAAFHTGPFEIGDRTLIPVLKARFRGFEAVLQATGQNLAALRRAEDQESLARSFGSYDQGQGAASIWSQTGISKLEGPKGHGDRV